MARRPYPDISAYTKREDRERAFMLGINIRLSDRIRGWHSCKLPLCRRQRACMGETFVCVQNWRLMQAKATPEQAENARLHLISHIKHVLAHAAEHEQAKPEVAEKPVLPSRRSKAT